VAEKSFRCTLITPEERVFEEDATAVTLPLHDGSAGVLPMRAPFVAKLGLGEFRITFEEGGSRSFYLEEGFAQMSGSKLTLLAQHATPAESISTQEAEAELAEANARTPNTTDEMRTVAKDRRRAQAKIMVAQRFRDHGGGI